MRKIFMLSLLTSVFNPHVPPVIKWVAIGDSITYLNEHNDETGKRVTKGYLTRVVEKLPTIQYVNKGYNGWTATDIANKIEELGLEKADVYSVLLGTNDWWQGKPLGILSDYKNNTGNGTVYGSFRTIINKLRTLNQNAKIILMTPMQRADFVAVSDFNNNALGSYKEKNGQTLAQFAAVVKDICSLENFVCIDLYNNKNLQIDHLVNFKRLKEPGTRKYKNYTYPSYTAIPFDPKRDKYPYPLAAMNMTYDGLHPSDQGNEIIANLLVDILK